MKHINARFSRSSSRRISASYICIISLAVVLIAFMTSCEMTSCEAHDDDKEYTGSAMDRITLHSDPDSIVIIEQFAENNACYIENEALTVKGLMLHSVGASQPSARIFARNYNVQYPYGSAICPHAFIQSDGTVYQILPWDTVGWHSGGSSNETHIGVEMCEPDTITYTGANEFTLDSPEEAKQYVDDTYNRAITLFARLCIEYNLNPLEDGVIISHSEGCALGVASNHGDPEYLWRGVGLPYTMDTFRAAVAVRMDELNTQV